MEKFKDNPLKYLKGLGPLTSAVWIVWSIQLALRLGTAVSAATNNTLAGDQYGYWVLGRHVWAYLTNGNCERLPLYPLFLSIFWGVSRLFSLSTPAVAGIVFAAQHGLMMVAIHLISKLVVLATGRTRSYLVSLVMLTCYYPMLLYPNGMLTETLFIFLSVSASYFLFRGTAEDETVSRQRQFFRFGVAGALMGGAALVRPNMLLFPFILALIIWVIKRSRLKPVIVFLVFFCIVLSPWIGRNYTIYGRLAYCSVSGANLYKKNAFKAPLTYEGRAIEKQYKRHLLLPAEKQELGEMKNSLASFMDHGDVYRNSVYMEHAVENIKWHINYELSAFLFNKIKSFLPAFFQGSTLEYHYANVAVNRFPNWANNIYHIVLMILACCYLSKKRLKVRTPEIVLLANVAYNFLFFMFAPAFPRLMLPMVVFAIYFAVLYVDELWENRALSEGSR